MSQFSASTNPSKAQNYLLTTVAQIKEQLNPELQIAGFVPTMFDGRTAQESRTMQALEENLAQIAPVFPPIPRAIAFADASEENLPLALYDKKHSAIKILKRDCQQNRCHQISQLNLLRK